MKFGKWKTTRKHVLRQQSEQTRQILTRNCRIIRFVVGAQTLKGRGREEDCRSIWITCSWATRRKDKHWHLWWQENEREELCSAPCSRGNRRENGYAEGRWHGCVRSDWTRLTSLGNRLLHWLSTGVRGWLAMVSKLKRGVRGSMGERSRRLNSAQSRMCVHEVALQALLP